MLVTPVSDNPMFDRFDKALGVSIPTVSSKTWIDSRLIEAFGGIEYASLGTLQGEVHSCLIEEQTTSRVLCKTEVEFVNYVKPFMEN